MPSTLSKTSWRDLTWNRRQDTIRNTSIPAWEWDQTLTTTSMNKNPFEGINVRIVFGTALHEKVDYKWKPRRGWSQDMNISNVKLKHKMNAWMLTVTAKLWHLRLWHFEPTGVIVTLMICMCKYFGTIRVNIPLSPVKPDQWMASPKLSTAHPQTELHDVARKMGREWHRVFHLTTLPPGRERERKREMDSTCCKNKE